MRFCKFRQGLLYAALLSPRAGFVKKDVTRRTQLRGRRTGATKPRYRDSRGGAPKAEAAMCHYYGRSISSQDQKAPKDRANDAARERQAGVIERLLRAAKEPTGESKPAKASAREPASAK